MNCLEIDINTPHKVDYIVVNDHFSEKQAEIDFVFFLY